MVAGASKQSTSSETPAIGVVIPFFQSKSGLLARAIGSVITQRDADAAAIIVVDDGSPLPARNELATLPETVQRRMTLLEQRNAGVSAARNAALDAMPAEITFVAFLDADDAWYPPHLANALAALSQGFDLYFSDHRREGAPLSRFGECDVDTTSGEKLPVGKNLYRHTGDLFASIFRKSLIGTSTVVFRRAIAPELRFLKEISVGEDTMFWLMLATRGARAAFSLDEEVDYGWGVNIFAGADWDSPTALTMLSNSAAFHRLAPKFFPLPPDLAAWNTERRRQIRREFALNFFHLIRRQQKIDWRSVRRFLLAEPALLAEILAAPLTHAREKE